MLAHLSRPTATRLNSYLALREEMPYSYLDIGASAGVFPVNYYQHTNRFYLGQGKVCWSLAKQAIAEWQPFNTSWAQVYPKYPPIRREEIVAVSFYVFGVWWTNSCRIVYVVDEAKKYGFAYGTLPGHVGRGEEYFGVEQDEEGKCWFILKAFSQPAYWGARLFPFVMRHHQQRFVRVAAASMQTYCGTTDLRP